ncbi:MAG: alanine racemase [Pseudomonadota bacterium]
MNQPDPTLRLKVDTRALANNWRALNTLSGAGSAGAAVKADCYGLGVEPCVPVLRDAGCQAYFVAHWSEVEPLARHVPPEQIAVLHGAINAEEIAYARECGAVPVLNSLSQARAWHGAGGGACHLMIDTGINRLGISVSEIHDPAIQVLTINTLMSHLACADEDHEMNDRQLAAFADARTLIQHSKASLANSAGIALGEGYAFDLTRPGVALYGGIPRSELENAIEQVAHVEAAIIQTRKIKAGDTIGYNAEFRANRIMQVATVSLGYADGFLRSRGQDNHLLYGETQLPIIGKVSMDMIVVDLTNAPTLKEGDWLSVPFHLPNAAQQSGLSQYELLTTLGHRLRTL